MIPDPRVPGERLAQAVVSRASVRVSPSPAPRAAPRRSTCRPFRAGDEGGVAALLCAAFGPIAPLRASCSYPVRYLQQRVRSGELRPHLAIADGRVVGHVGRHREPAQAGWRTGASAVAAVARGRRVAERLKEASLATLPDDATDVFALTIGVHPWTQRVHPRLTSTGCRACVRLLADVGVGRALLAAPRPLLALALAARQSEA